MKPSRFNIWLKDYPEKDEYVVFNSRTQALVKINSGLKDTLDKLERLNPEELSLFSRGCISALKQNGIVVEDDREEEARLQDFFRQLKYDSSGLPFEATILTTYSCNFRCVYCFEESVKDDVFLSKDTGDLIVKWLIRGAEERGLKRVYLVYYGGEPLLNVRPVYDISWQLKQWAARKGIGFGFGIITNGSLLNPDLVEKLLTVGLEEVRVTIDGRRDHHNKKRPFIDGRPTFDLLIENIGKIIDKVPVSISGNFDKDNFKGIPEFLDYLEELGLLAKLKRVDFSPLTPRLGPRTNPGAIELGSCLSFVGKDGLFNEVLELKKELLRRGLKTRTGLAVNACALLMREAAVTIDPRGAIYKCNALVGYPEFSVGNVAQEDFNPKFREFMDIEAWKNCPQDCRYLPMCQGGCRFFSYLENHNFTEVSCKKEYFDRITPQLIKLEYQKLKDSA